MEIIVESKNKCIGIDEDVSNLSDIDYLQTLPFFSDSLGVISDDSWRVLDKEKRQLVKKNIMHEFYLKKSRFFLAEKKKFFAYSFRNFLPVFYEVPGFNRVVNFSGKDFLKFDTISPFLLNGHGFLKQDFEKLEESSNYLVCSYYDGGACHLYMKDSLVNSAITSFAKLCNETCGQPLNIMNLPKN
jgi:hypothetical protein